MAGLFSVLGFPHEKNLLLLLGVPSSTLDEEIPGSGCQGTSGLCRRVPWVPRNSHSSGRRSYKVAPLPTYVFVGLDSANEL